MKRFLFITLLSLFSLAFGLNTRAQSEALSFGYCTDDIMGMNVGMADVYYAAAIAIPEDVAQTYRGSDLIGMSIGFGYASPTEVTMFLTYDLKEEPFYTQQATCEMYQFKYFDFDTPYTLQGKKVYLGFKYFCMSKAQYPIGVDYSGQGEKDGTYLAFSKEESDLLQHWSNIDYPFGNLCIRAYLKGDALPQHDVEPLSLKAPGIVEAGKEFDLTLTLYNNGAADINSVDVEYIVGDGEPVLTTVSLDEPLLSGRSMPVPVPAVTTTADPETPVMISASVAKVNGEENASAGVTVSASTISVKESFERRTVFEEYTGTACGFCPRGYVGMEYMHDTYPEFIGIGVHTYNKDDEMFCESYLKWSEKYVTGAPSGTLDRHEVLNPTKYLLESKYNAMDKMALERVRLDDVKITENEKGEATISFKAFTGVLNSRKESTYALAFVITQDNMGPFMQTNYYSGGTDLPEFGDLGSQTPLMFNDVARYISPEWNGIENSVPAELLAGEEYVYEGEIALHSLMSRPVAPLVIEDSRLIALLLDTSDGNIVNADRVDFPEVTAVETVGGEPCIRISGGIATVTVSGAFDRASAYSVDGSLKASFIAGEHPVLAPGLYIVSVRHGSVVTSAKVSVK